MGCGPCATHPRSDFASLRTWLRRRSRWRPAEKRRAVESDSLAVRFARLIRSVGCNQEAEGVVEASPAATIDGDEAREDARPLDADGFVRLFESSYDGVFRYLRARCPTDDEAADLTATAFERAWQSRHRFRGSSSGSSAWIFQIARRLAIDAARTRTARQRGLILWPPPGTAPDPAELVLRDERDHLLATRLQSLPDLQREVLLLRFAGGLTSRAIGEVIGKREEATQKLITRALGRLKEAYRDSQ